MNEANTFIEQPSAQDLSWLHPILLAGSALKEPRAAEKHRVLEVGPAVSTGTVHAAAATIILIASLAFVVCERFTSLSHSVWSHCICLPAYSLI